MKPAIAGAVLILLAACHGQQPDSVNEQLASTSQRQLADAEALQEEYLDCIKDLGQKTAMESYTDKNTRQVVVLESCSEIAARFTVVLEQGYDNACRAEDKAQSACDSEAVRKAKVDTDRLMLQARELINRTSASRRNHQTQ